MFHRNDGNHKSTWLHISEEQPVTQPTTRNELPHILYSYDDLYLNELRFWSSISMRKAEMGTGLPASRNACLEQIAALEVSCHCLITICHNVMYAVILLKVYCL